MGLSLSLSILIKTTYDSIHIVHSKVDWYMTYKNTTKQKWTKQSIYHDACQLLSLYEHWYHAYIKKKMIMLKGIMYYGLWIIIAWCYYLFDNDHGIVASIAVIPIASTMSNLITAWLRMLSTISTTIAVWLCRHAISIDVHSGPNRVRKRQPIPTFNG